MFDGYGSELSSAVGALLTAFYAQYQLNRRAAVKREKERERKREKRLEALEVHAAAMPNEKEREKSAERLERLWIEYEKDRSGRMRRPVVRRPDNDKS